MIWFTADWHFFHDRILDFHPKRRELFGNDMKEVTEKMIQKLFRLNQQAILLLPQVLHYHLVSMEYCFQKISVKWKLYQVSLKI